MSSEHFPAYLAAKNEIISVKLNLSNYVIQKEIKNLTGSIDTSDFALKTNVAKIKKKVDDIDVDKIDELQRKIY